MANYPLLFSFNDKVAGDGFLADVTVQGRALAVQEADGWWFYGVQPGGVSAGGQTPREAHGEFRVTFRSILHDIAGDAESFEAFKAEVEKFFSEVDEVSEREWHEAVAQVRAGTVTADSFPIGGQGLRKEPADSARSVEVVEMEHPTAAANVIDPYPAMAA